MPNPVLVEVTRGDLVESIHRGAVAIVDAAGAVRFSLGDIDAPIYTRSALKPFQALPLVESGAAEAFGVSDEEVALACASHSGESMHTTRVAAWLKRIGCSEADLICGPQTPRHEPTLQTMAETHEKPSRLHNNCSGKHAGFLTVAKHLGAPTADYVNISHPVQKAILESVSRLSDYRDPAWGIDGCAAPNFALPLTAFARALARLATGQTPGAARILKSMTTYPELVAGTGRHCTALMRAAQGKVAVKLGAEGVYAAMLPELGLGVALKIDDGAMRAAETAIAFVLEKLNVIPAGYATAPVVNTRGATVGERRPAEALQGIG
ncbi:asparaginase [Rhizomicrobium electricum]|uniref:Asparaginase n=1 Tax=Rhizomicrobium electricum TaxID=480070 RepID=A0ABP3P8U9_9PROT|nr:asparaginase [Rhizomicrobium electricum]NIJ47607.1 L-asparaginase II [Rhizomicrobium electricum]